VPPCRHFASQLRRQFHVSISFGEKGCGGVDVEQDVVVVAVEVLLVLRCRTDASRLLPPPPPRSSR
jgi:hypothetical protein